MDLLRVGLLAAVFVLVASSGFFVVLALRGSQFAEKSMVKRRLLYLSAGGGHGVERFSVYRDAAMKDAGLLGGLLLRLPRSHRLDRLIVRSGTRMNTTTFILSTLVLGLGGYALGAPLLPQPAAAPLIGVVMAAVPFLWLKSRERASLARFEEQLPEALDLMARAMRSGHALSSAMEVVAQEMEAPIAPEFAAAVDEIKFGLGLQDVLENLCSRVPLADLRFLAIAVLVHKETGGNITEVFSNISRLVRQRLQFRRQLKALTAEGRISAIVMLLLPPAMFAYLYFAAYKYVSTLWTDQTGHAMVAGALVAQAVGYLVMKKMVNFDV